MIFQVDNRIGGLPRYFVGSDREVLVRIPDEIQKCVAFVYYRKAMADPPKAGGTVFFVGVGPPNMSRGLSYAVTARHVIEELYKRSQDGKILLRTRLRNAELAFFETKPEDWFFHPTDETVDVAILPMKVSANDERGNILMALDIHQFGPLPNGTASPAVIADEGFGAGDEVFIIGLFSNHPGATQNIPITRIGNIAAMPQERVKTKWHDRDIEAYLIEARSIGGLSGSPVFVHPGPLKMSSTSIPGQGNLLVAKHRSGPHYLLGLMHGHFDVSLLDISPDTDTEDSVKQVEINCGIAIVVPVSKILEVLDQPRLLEDRERLFKNIARGTAGTPD
jgi:hypothetical protein